MSNCASGFLLRKRCAAYRSQQGPRIGIVALKTQQVRSCDCRLKTGQPQEAPLLARMALLWRYKQADKTLGRRNSKEKKQFS
jgi:hypothetical protein